MPLKTLLMELVDTLTAEFYDVFADSKQEAIEIAVLVTDNWEKLKNADCDVFYEVFSKSQFDSERAHATFYAIKELKTAKWFRREYL